MTFCSWLIEPWANNSVFVFLALTHRIVVVQPLEIACGKTSVSAPGVGPSLSNRHCSAFENTHSPIWLSGRTPTHTWMGHVTLGLVWCSGCDEHRVNPGKLANESILFDARTISTAATTATTVRRSTKKPNNHRGPHSALQKRGPKASLSWVLSRKFRSHEDRDWIQSEEKGIVGVFLFRPRTCLLSMDKTE